MQQQFIELFTQLWSNNSYHAQYSTEFLTSLKDLIEVKITALCCQPVRSTSLDLPG